MSTQVLAPPVKAFTPSLTTWQYVAKPEAIIDDNQENLFADLFCGGGGSLLGGVRVFARLGFPEKASRVIAVNHDPRAIDTCRANHPNVEAIDCDLERLDPAAVLKGRRLRALWASAPCQNHSKAAAGKPKNRQKRATPDYILDWIRVGQPNVYFEENVWEITQWDDETGSWAAHVAAIKALGYNVEYRKENAADYGVPQSRERLILIAVRKDLGKPKFPAATHSDPEDPIPGTKPWVGAITALDLSKPAQSIWNRHYPNGKPKKPLVWKTRRRIARYIRARGRFWRPVARQVELRNGHPLSLAYLLNHCPRKYWPAWVLRNGEAKSINEFLMGFGGPRGAQEPRDAASVARTVLTENHTGFVKVSIPLDPLLHHLTHGGRSHSPAQVSPTITAAHRGELALTQILFLLGQQGGAECRTVEYVAPTVATAGYIRLGEVRFILPPEGPYRGNAARPAEDASATIGAERGGEHRLNEVRLVPFTPALIPCHGEHAGQEPRIRSADAVSFTIPCSRTSQLAMVFIHTYNGEAQADPVTDPSTTLTTVQRHQIVVVDADLLKTDVTTRMLAVPELAGIQGFPAWYRFVGNQGEQIQQIGNAVPPGMAEANIEANAVFILGGTEVTA